ncbi:MAG TPA: helix-hairpin-helix domain-containing protein, partial [Fimbriimonas sp.]|nr:helix-hairpin-helix domain-containing protein [Fimbriimonas sp.]
MRRRGIVLVVVLAALAGVMAGIAIYSMNQRDAMFVSVNRTEARRARLAAEGGIQLAMASLQSVAEAPESPVTLEDDWAILGSNGAEAYKIGNDSFRVQIVDNTGKLDVNFVTEEVLENLPLTQEQIDSFLDWREVSTSPRASGAKDEYYNALPRPYNTRMGRIQTLSELLLIRDFTPATLYEIQEGSVNTTRTGTNELPLSEILGVDCYSAAFMPEGDGKVNLNQQGLTAQQLAQRAQISQQVATTIINNRAGQPNGQFTALSQVLALPGVSNSQDTIRNILDRTTTSTSERVEGKINVNTCNAEVLSYLTGVTQDIANQIVDNRPTDGYQALSDLLSVSSDSDFVGTIGDFFNVNSQSFEVRVIGKAGRTTVTLVAIVQISQGVPTLLRIEEAPLANMEATWQWDEEVNENIL